MLTAVCTSKAPGDDRKLIIVGLTFSQLRRLMAGDPVSENLTPVGMEATLFVFAGSDNKDILRKLSVRFPGVQVIQAEPPADAGA